MIRRAINNDIALLKRKYIDLDTELADIYSMTEEQACDLYDVGSKAEIIERFNSKLESLAEQMDSLEDELKATDAQEYGNGGFRSETDFWRWKGAI